MRVVNKAIPPTNTSPAGVFWDFLRSLIAPSLALAEIDTGVGTLGEVAVGEYVGTGAALNVPLPFDPVFVMIIDFTDGTIIGFAINTPSVGTKSTTINAALGPVTDAATGINFGAAGTNKFTLGIDAAQNIAAKTYQYLAIGV